MNKKDMKMYSQVLMGAAAVSVVLASTQWLLVAAVLALFGVYLKMG